MRVYEVKKPATEAVLASKNVMSNLVSLVTSVALLVASVTCYLMVRGNIDPKHLSQFSKVVIIGSCAEMGLLGAWYLTKFLNK